MKILTDYTEQQFKIKNPSIILFLIILHLTKIYLLQDFTFFKVPRYRAYLIFVLCDFSWMYIQITPAIKMIYADHLDYYDIKYVKMNEVAAWLCWLF